MAMLLALLTAGAALAQTPSAATCFKAAVDAPARLAACKALAADTTAPARLRADAEIAQAEIHARENELAAAVARFSAALALVPNDTAALLARGRALESTGDVAGADRDYAAALAADPTLSDAQAARARLQAANDVEPLRRQAMVAGRRQDFAAAIAAFTALLSRRPDDIPARKGRGVAHLQAGAPAQAIADFDAVLAAQPSDTEVRFFRATAAFRAGELTMAETDFTAVLTQRPGEPDALAGRGLARVLLTRFDDAEADFTAALQAAPGRGDLLGHRGQTRFLRGNLTGAAADLAAALETDAASPTLALWRYLAAPDTAALHAARTRAGSTWPADRWPMAAVAHALGERPEAEVWEQARQGGDTAFNEAEAAFYLGLLAERHGDTAAAIQLLRRAAASPLDRSFAVIGARAVLTRK